LLYEVNYRQNLLYAVLTVYGKVWSMLNIRESLTTPNSSEIEQANDNPTHSLFFQHKLAIIMPVRILHME